MNPLPLEGTGVLVTRPKLQCSELAAEIEARGGNAYRMPVLEIAPRDSGTVEAELAGLPPPDIVIYVSSNAVQHGLNLLAGLSAAASIAAIGPATRNAIEAAGFDVSIHANSGYDSEHLLRHDALRALRGKNVLIVRGNHGRELLADTLRSRGATVNYLAVYERVSAAIDDQAIAQLESSWQNGDIEYVIAMSVDSLTSLLNILPAGCRSLLQKSWLVTPSKRVIQTALELLPGVRSVLAGGPQNAAMVDAIIRSRHQSTIESK